MCARNLKAISFIFLLCLAPQSAFAKTSTFASRSMFGIGINAQIEQKPNTDFVATPQSYHSSFSHAFGLEPFADFGNFVVKTSFNLHSLPEVDGAGSDSIGSFTEGSTATLFSYGVSLELIPYVAESQRERIFVKLGAGFANAYVTNTRNYKSGGVVTHTYEEKDHGNTQYILASTGVEFFLLQNYSLEVNLGYQSLRFGELDYHSASTVKGAAAVKGNAVVNPSGNNKALDASGPYASLAFNLHF